MNVRGRVRNGRLIVDEPTDLPDRTEVELVAVDPLERALAAAPASDEQLSPAEAAELRAIAKGPFVSHAEVRKKIAARRVP